MAGLQILFHRASKDAHIIPYIRDQKSIEYICNGKEGTVLFNGYYYIEQLPAKALMQVRRGEVDSAGGVLIASEEHFYMIEIYDRDIYESTNETSEIDDDHGGFMEVCFFPTNRQRLHFRILDFDLTIA